jgi:hypothetical protein
MPSSKLTELKQHEHSLSPPSMQKDFLSMQCPLVMVCSAAESLGPARQGTVVLLKHAHVVTVIPGWPWCEH